MDVPEICVNDVKAMLDRGDTLLLLDVRESDEHATASIDAAKLIPMSEIQDRVGELEPHQNEPIVVHCHHGGRSAQVTQWLMQQGFTNVQNMTGGIDVWSQQIDSSVPRY